MSACCIKWLVSLVTLGAVLPLAAQGLVIQSPEQMRVEFLKLLPTRMAITQTLGDGRGELFFIIDPLDPRSRELVRRTQSLTNGTIHYYLAPNGEYDSGDLARRIWCARDRTQALLDVMLAQRELPVARKSCAATELADLAFTVNNSVLRPRPGVLTARGLGAGVPDAAHLESVKFPYEAPARGGRKRAPCGHYNEEGLPDCSPL